MSKQAEWHVEKRHGRYEIWPEKSEETHCYIGVVQTQEHADRIVRAVNCHDKLLAACKQVVGMVESMHEVPPTRFIRLRDAIAKAEGR